MRRYVIVLAIVAVLVGSLFRAADETGVRLMKMFATLGIFLFGVVGSMAITRLQSRAGLKELEGALKSLEPDGLITDWAHQGGGKPDYLVVGPGGLVAVCLDETPQSTWARLAAGKVARGRERVLSAARWVREQLTDAELPVETVLVLTRRKALADYAADGVAVLNVENLSGHIRARWDRELLTEQARIKLTRHLRQAAGNGTKE